MDLDVGDHRQPLVTRSIRAISETSAKAIIISSEALEGLLRNRQNAQAFFNRVRELNLEPKLILFPRTQPQWINSSYSHLVKSFRRSDSFQSSVFGFARSPAARFSRWIDLAETHNAEYTGYCGLTTAIARQFEEELRSDNDAFARQVWGESWADIFGADLTEEFTPNDFELRHPNWFTARRFRRATKEMIALAEKILKDPAHKRALERRGDRSGLVSKE